MGRRLSREWSSPRFTWSTSSAPGSPHTWQMRPYLANTRARRCFQSFGSRSLRVEPRVLADMELGGLDAVGRVRVALVPARRKVRAPALCHSLALPALVQPVINKGGLRFRVAELDGDRPAVYRHLHLDPLSRGGLDQRWGRHDHPAAEMVNVPARRTIRSSEPSAATSTQTW